MVRMCGADLAIWRWAEMCWGHKEGCSSMLVRHGGETSRNLLRNRSYNRSWKCRMHQGRVLVLPCCSMFWFEAVPWCRKGGQCWHFMQTAAAHHCLAWWAVFCLSAGGCSHSHFSLKEMWSCPDVPRAGMSHCSSHQLSLLQTAP